MSPRLVAAMAGLVAVLVVGCGVPAAPTLQLTPFPTSEASLGPRPSSPATLTITAPTAGQQLIGPTVHVVINLVGATITTAVTTNITPTEGHIHLYVNNVLTSMNYGAEQDLTLTAGTYALKAEFVAADHAPFSPRVWSEQVLFTVA